MIVGDASETLDTFHDNGHFVGAWIKLLDEARRKSV